MKSPTSSKTRVKLFPLCKTPKQPMLNFFSSNKSRHHIFDCYMESDLFDKNSIEQVHRTVSINLDQDNSPLSPSKDIQTRVTNGYYEKGSDALSNVKINKQVVKAIRRINEAKTIEKYNEKLKDVFS